MTNKIAGEDTILSSDFTAGTGTPVLTEVGKMDVLFSLMKSPSTFRVILSATIGVKRVVLEEIVVSNSLTDVIRSIVANRVSRTLATAFDCRPERLASFLCLSVAPLVEQLQRRQDSPPVAPAPRPMSREERDRERAWGDTTQTLVPITGPAEVFHSGQYHRILG